MPANAEIARLLHELATLTELDERDRQSFRARAYHSAVRAIESEPRDVAQLSVDELTAIKGIGKAIAAKIREYADTGTIAKVEELRARYPVGYVDLVRVPGIGPKTVALLKEHLGVQTLDDLKAAISEGKLADVPGLGERTQQNLARELDRLGLVGKERRLPIAEAMPMAEEIVAFLARLPQAERVAYAGSLRRFRETAADVDVLVASTDPAPITEAFTAIAMAREVIASGEKRSSIITAKGIQVDLRIVDPSQWGAALVYFTGSKDHNIRIRERAVRRGWTLNEYGLFELTDEGMGALIAAASEEEIYGALDLAWVPPAMREDNGEVAAAEAGTLPRLATAEDVIGDLHVHTDLSGDGRDSLADMLAAARRRGLHYLATTDHAEDLRINGVGREEMLAQRRHLAEVQDEHPDVRILHGAELNIGVAGDLDYDEDFRRSYDWTVASVHSHFRLDRAAQTERIITAMHDPGVGCIGHLQGRRVGKRPPIDIDVDAILGAAEETGTAIEINSNLDRLDASAEVLLAARGREVVFVINTDAHSTRELERYVHHGVRQAERGWVPADRIANTWDLDRFLEFARAKRER